MENNVTRLLKFNVAMFYNYFYFYFDLLSTNQNQNKNHVKTKTKRPYGRYKSRIKK
jgi:hypothetical protein